MIAGQAASSSKAKLALGMTAMNPVFRVTGVVLGQAGGSEALLLTAGLVLSLLVLVGLVYLVGWGKTEGPQRLGAVLLLAAALVLGFPPPRPLLTMAFDEKAP